MIKKFVTAGLLAASFGIAHAGLLVYEGFDYSGGIKVPTLNGGSGWSNAWQDITSYSNAYWETNTGTLPFQNDTNVGSLEVSGGYITSGGSSTSQTRLIERSFTPTFNTTTNSDMWFSVLAAGPADNMDINLFGGGSKRFGWQMDGDITLTNGATVTDDSNFSMSSGSATFLVANIDFDAGTIQYWLNPEVGGSTPINADYDSGVLTTTVTSIDAIRLFSNDKNGTVDEIRLGTSYADIAVIPEASTLALFSCALGIMLIYGRTRR